MRRSSWLSMLRGCWLLTDLDGTLVPTPHKAHGQYLTLAQGPCFPTMVRWLSLGGNVCVITTADRRVFDQVYVPLRPYLSSNASNAVNTPAMGQLLISMYTGAVLYHATKEGIALESGYLSYPHQLHAGGVVTPCHPAAAVPSSPGQQQYVTCIAPSICETLYEMMGDIFMNYARDIIFEVPEAVASLQLLSRRYRQMWSKLLHYLTAKYQHHASRQRFQTAQHAFETNNNSKEKGPSTTSTSVPNISENAKTNPESSSNGAAVSSSDERVWKYNYLRSHRKILNHVGIVRQEQLCDIPQQLQSAAATPADNTTPVPGVDIATKEQRSMDNNGKDNVHEEFVLATQKLLGVEAVPDPPTGPSTTTSAHRDTPGGVTRASSSHSHVHHSAFPVAQLIVVGMPMKLFPRYFGPYVDAFHHLGVTAIAQPNSVVFSRRGIDKSSAVRYLCKDSLPKNVSIEHVKSRFAQSVNLRRAVALGDNPHTADHQLTVFPALDFVSVEREDQRAQRHERIRESGGEGSESGPLMDDRRIPHLHFVGGEEDGTQLFLDELIRMLENDAKRTGASSSSTSTTKTNADTVKEKDGCMDPQQFHDAVIHASRSAAHQRSMKRSSQL